ncbi:unnamed protein product [Sphacelaria rigidula]
MTELSTRRGCQNTCWWYNHHMFRRACHQAQAIVMRASLSYPGDPIVSHASSTYHFGTSVGINHMYRVLVGGHFGKETSEYYAELGLVGDCRCYSGGVRHSERSGDSVRNLLEPSASSP